jgi:hypothetical protein
MYTKPGKVTLKGSLERSRLRREESGKNDVRKTDCEVAG